METQIRNEVPSLRLINTETDKQFQPAISRHINFPEREMRLLEKLQTTLELQDLIEIFSTETVQIVPFDGLIYSHEQHNEKFTYGQKYAHRCSYSLKIDDVFLGDITFYRRKRFTEKELGIIEVLMSSMVYPLKNALLYKQALNAAFTDPLTKALNRTSLKDTLTREIELAKRHDDDLAVMLIDADHFKNINDTFGHSHGDAVLRTIADISHDTIRQSDVLFRYGGEEFLVLLNQTNMEGAKLLAERIRENIAGVKTINGIKSNVTVSIGVTTIRPDDCCLSIFDRADKALYQAKNNGRNRCEIIIEA